MGGETVQPDGISFDPEPTLSISGNSEDVLDIEGSFDLRVGRLVGSNDVGSGKRGDSDTELGGKLGEIGRRVVLVLEFDYTSRGVTVNFSVGSSVHDLDGLRGDGDGSLRVEVALLLDGLELADGELRESSNEVNALGHLSRDRKFAKLTNDLLARFVLENLEGGGEETRGNSNGGLSVDGISAVFDNLSTTINQPTHNLLGFLDRRRDQRGDCLNAHEVTVGRVVRVGHIPEDLLELFEVLLVKSNNEGNFLRLLDCPQRRRGV